MSAPAVLANAGNNVLQQWKIFLTMCSLSETLKTSCCRPCKTCSFFSIHRTFTVTQGHKTELNFTPREIVFTFLTQLICSSLGSHTQTFSMNIRINGAFAMEFTFLTQFGQLYISTTEKHRLKEDNTNSVH